jgi:hypothetical protein
MALVGWLLFLAYFPLLVTGFVHWLAFATPKPPPRSAGGDQ